MRQQCSWPCRGDISALICTLQCNLALALHVSPFPTPARSLRMNEVRRQQAAVTRRMMATVSELSLYQVRMMMRGAERGRVAVALRKGWRCRLAQGDGIRA